MFLFEFNPRNEKSFICAFVEIFVNSLRFAHSVPSHLQLFV